MFNAYSLLLSLSTLATISFNLFYFVFRFSLLDLFLSIFHLYRHLSLAALSSLQSFALKTFFHRFPVPPPHLASPSLSFLFLPSSVPQFLHLHSHSLSLPLNGIMQKLRLLIGSQWVSKLFFLQCTGFLYPLLTHAYADSCAHTSTLTWSCCFFSLCIFSLTHAECVISSAWCPPPGEMTVSASWHSFYLCPPLHSPLSTTNSSALKMQ